MQTKDYIEKLGVLPSECACDKCSSMCEAPCTGSVEDIERIIESGYAKRLMFDDLPHIEGDTELIKPAMKGSEGKQAPWATRTEEGCTFWKDGKCELHECGLKPILGKLAYHNRGHMNYDKFSEIAQEDWQSQRARDLIEKWKKLVDYDKRKK